MSVPAAPASPTKRGGLLRSLVTGVDSPVDRETHAQRWQRTPAGPRSPYEPSDKTQPTQRSPTKSMGPGPRVASLVQGWEEASLGGRSRPYDALAPSLASPSRLNFAREAGNERTTLRVDVERQNPTKPGEPVSPVRGVSPTVPASLFQMQAKRSTNQSPTKFDPQRKHALGKENESPTAARSNGDRSGRPVLGLPVISTSLSISEALGGSPRAETDVATTVTIETMATRSSDSTHASSLLSNSAENAQLGRAERVEVRQEEAKRFGTFPRAPAGPPPRFQPPEQARQQSAFPVPPGTSRPAPTTSDSSYRSSGAVSPARHSSIAQERPIVPRAPFDRPAMQHRPVSSFIEALPPRPNAPSPGAVSHTWYPEEPYSALPTEAPVARAAPAAQGQGGLAAGQTRRRPRSSSVGAGAKPMTVQHVAPVESAAQRAERVDSEFAKLLDTMQLPDQTVRSKMLGLALPLKEEMLRTAGAPKHSLRTSQHQRGRSMNLATSSSTSVERVKEPASASSGIKSFLRKAKSNSSLRARNDRDGVHTVDVEVSSSDGRRARSRSHSRTALSSSVHVPNGKFRPASGIIAETTPQGSAAPVYWAHMLRSSKIEDLRVKELGQLRGRLRNESPSWIHEFVRSGGYVGLLARVKDLLEKEWREEQHDDQILYEVLRCLRALTMTNVGKRTLASHSPTPFLPFASLLFSEKRPGDLPCRQILVELLHAVFQICPPSCDALPRRAWSQAEISLEPAPVSSRLGSSSGSFSSNEGGSGGVRRYTRRIKSADEGDDSTTVGSAALEREEVLTPERIQQAHRFVVSLMQGPPNEEEDAKVDFIQRAHRDRPYKVWVKEIADCVRDYFWVFCHANNLFWTLEQIDTDAIEAPKVPSGMTGGVEYEAMAYCTVHLRLINEIARTCPSPAAAFAFHEQLFLSGFERVLFTLRRASLVYYQSLHLEMSRYIALARAARFNLGPRILACLDRRSLRPEEAMVVQEAERRNHQSRSGAPQLGAVF